MKEKKGRKILIGIFIGLGVGLVTAFGIIVVFIIYFFTGGPVQRNKNVDKYAETMHKYRFEVVGKVQTGLFAFPETIPESAFENGAEPVFFFSYKDTWDDPTCEVYLECKYSDADYQMELERLKNDELVLEDHVGNKMIHKLEYEESKRFIRPVYKAIDCYNHAYEYAMDLGNNEIAYIYTSFKSNPMSLKKVPKDYLPDDYTETLLKNTYENGGYNIYITERTDELTAFDYGNKFE